MYDSEVMCRKEVDTPWSIYRDLTVYDVKYFLILRPVSVYTILKKAPDVSFCPHRPWLMRVSEPRSTPRCQSSSGPSTPTTTTTSRPRSSRTTLSRLASVTAPLPTRCSAPWTPTTTAT